MTVHVPPAVMRGIQARQAIIDQYQHVADSLKSELAGFITKQLGVNLEDGDWRLNTEQGILEHVHGQQPQPLPEIGVELPAADSSGHEGTEGSGSGPAGEPSQA